MKKIASLLLSCTLVLCSLNTRVFAACNTPDESLLVEMGFPVEIIEIMPNSDKADFIEAYINKAECVGVSTSTMEVDVLAEMKVFVRKTDAELLSAGYSQAQIDQGRSIINKYNNTTDDELLNEGLDEFEVACLRGALDPNSTNGARGQIAPAKLMLTLSSYAVSTTRPDYSLRVYFNWSSPFIWDIHTDKVIIAWGGALLQTQALQNISYYKLVAFGGYGDYFSTQPATYQEIAPNAMGIYYFPQTYTIMAPNPNAGSGRIKSGSINFSLSQTRFDGRDTKVVAYYAHQISSIVGSISFTGTQVTPGVSIGTGYDTMYAETAIRY